MDEEPSTSTGKLVKPPRLTNDYWKKPLKDDELQEEADNIETEVWSDFEESPSEYSYSGSDSSSETENNTDGNNLDISAPNNTLDNDEDTTWHEVNCSSLRFDIAFTGSETFKYHQGIYPGNVSDLSPVDIYNRFLDDEILDIIVLETNRNASQTLQKKVYSRSARIHR